MMISIFSTYKKFALKKTICLTLSFLMMIVAPLSFAEDKEPLSSQIALQQELQQYKGDVIYLDFWASWCGPCRKSFPWMNSMQKRYKDKGFTVISINLDAEYNLAQKFLAETPASFRVIYDPKGETARNYRVKGMPTSLLIGRNGQIKAMHTGFFNAKRQQYENEIQQLLSMEYLSHEK